MGAVLCALAPRASGGPPREEEGNDFELAVRAAKAIDRLLQRGLGCSGKTLQERIASAEESGRVPRALGAKLRYVTNVRNRLVHDRAVNAIADKQEFLLMSAEGTSQLQAIVDSLEGRKKQHRKSRKKR